MSARITESIVEDTALEWFSALGYSVVYGPSIAPGEAAAERVTIEGRRVRWDHRVRVGRRATTRVAPTSADRARWCGHDRQPRDHQSAHVVPIDTLPTLCRQSAEASTWTRWASDKP